MATTRTHDQFNTTIYGLEDRYRGIKNERRVIFMNQKDIDADGFVDGEKVDLFNYDDGIERIAPLFIIVAYPIPERNTVTYFPETNVLVSINNVVGESNMPASKYVRIKIRKHVPEIFEQVEKIQQRERRDELEPAWESVSPQASQEVSETLNLKLKAKF